MSITLVQKKAGTAGSVSASFTSATTAGNYVVVALCTTDTGTSGATGVHLGAGADNFTLLEGVAGGAGYIEQIWGDPNCDGGQTSIAVQGYTPNAATSIVIYEFAGVTTLDRHHSQQSNAGGAWSSGATNPTTDPNEVWVGCCGAQSTLNTAASPWINDAVGTHVAAGYQIVSSTAAATYNGAASGNFWGAAVVTLKGTPVVSQQVMPTQASRRSPSRAVTRFTPVTTTNPPPVNGSVQQRATVPVPRRIQARAVVRFTPVTTTNAHGPSGTARLAGLPSSRIRSGSVWSGSPPPVSAITGIQVKVPAWVSSGTLNFSLDSAATAGNAVILAVWGYQGVPTTVTFGGTAMNLAVSSWNPTQTDENIDLYYLTGVAGGQTAVAISGPATNTGAVAWEFAGLAASPLDKTANATSVTNSTSWSTPSTPTTTAADELLIGGFSIAGATSATGPASWSNQTILAGWALAGYTIVSAVGAYAYAGTMSPANHGGGSIATFKAAVGAAAASRGRYTPPPAVDRRRVITTGGWSAATGAVAAPIPAVTGGLIQHRKTTRAVVAFTPLTTVNNPAGPSGTVQPRATVRFPQRYPSRRAVTGTGTVAGGVAGAAYPGGSVQPRATIPIPRRFPARAVWAGGGAPSRRGTPVTGTGLVKRRTAARATVAQVLGLANAHGPAGAAPGGLIRRRTAARAAVAFTPVTTTDTHGPAGTPQPRASVPVPRRTTARAVVRGSAIPGLRAAAIHGTGLVKRRTAARAAVAFTPVATANAHGAAGTTQPRAAIPVPRRAAARARVQWNIGPASPIRLVSTWVGSYTAPVAPTTAPPPGPQSLPVILDPNTAGNWLFAIVCWRQAAGYPPVTFSVGDGVNHWEPMGAPSGTSPGTGDLRISVWRAAAARPVNVVSAAPTGYVISAAMAIMEFTGLEPWITESGTATVFVPAATSTGAIAAPAAAATTLWLTAAARGLSSVNTSYPAGPWSKGPSAATGNGTDHTGDLVLQTAFQQENGTSAPTWTGDAACDMAAIVCGVQVAAAPNAQPNTNWAPGTLEFAFGAGANTPPDELTWTAVDGATVDGLTLTRVQDFQFTQGQQYVIGALQAGQGSVTLDNRDLALTPPGIGPFAGIDAGVPWRFRVTWPGGNGYPANTAPHYVFTGLTAELPQTWNATRRGVIAAGLVDAWAYCQPQIRSALRNEIAADNPTVYWPNGDTAGSTGASNSGSGSTVPLTQVTSKYGAAGAVATFGSSTTLSAVSAAVGAASSGLPGDGGTVWAQTGLPAEVTSGGYCLYCQSPTFPPLNGAAGFTFEGWFALTDTAPLAQPGTLFSLKGTKGPVVVCTALATGLLRVTTTDVTGATVSTALGSAVLAGAGMFQAVWTWTAGTGWVFYLNGTKVAASGGTPSLAPTFAWLSAGGEADRFVTGNALNAEVGHIALFPQALTPARVAAHYYAGGLAFSAEPDNSRIERLITYAGYTSRRVIPAQVTPDLCASLGELGATAASSRTGFGAPIPAGQGTVQAGQEITSVIASLTPAMLFVASTGDLVYLPKSAAFGQPVDWTLGEDTAGGEIPYQWDVKLGYDPLRVINAIEVTQVDRQDVVSPEGFTANSPTYVPLATSVTRYGQQSYQINGYLFNDAVTPIWSANPSSVIDLANWVANTLGVPRERADQVSVDAATYPAAWPFVLGAQPSQVVVLNRRPITAGVSLVLLARVMRVQRQITWKAGGSAAKATVQLDYAPELTPLTLDDPVRGQLTGAYPLAW